jgi:hypothetical protein
VSNTKISEGSTWEFQFKPSKKYAVGNTIRFTFPVGFLSDEPNCDILNLFGANPVA